MIKNGVRAPENGIEVKGQPAEEPEVPQAELNADLPDNMKIIIVKPAPQAVQVYRNTQQNAYDDMFRGLPVYKSRSGHIFTSLISPCTAPTVKFLAWPSPALVGCFMVHAVKSERETPAKTIKKSLFFITRPPRLKKI